MPIKTTSKRKLSGMDSMDEQSSSMSQSMPSADVFSEFNDARMMPRRSQPKKMMMKSIVIIIVLITIAGFAGFALNNKSMWKQKANPKFHAVFLNTGQVYFGTIKNEDRENVTLENVYYVQMVDQQQPPVKEGDAPKTIQVPQLVKKGDEFYGPSNTIRINRNQITVIEDLTESSQVLKDIKTRMQQN